MDHGASYRVKDAAGREVLETADEQEARDASGRVHGTAERLYLAVTAEEVIADDRVP